MAIGAFGTIVLLLFGYLYWATTDYVMGRTDHAIATEEAILRTIYAKSGRDGLVAAVKSRVAEEMSDGAVYLLADHNLLPIAGNIGTWPAQFHGKQGRGSVAIDIPGASRKNRTYRAIFSTLPDGSRLLVGARTQDLAAFVKRIDVALVFTLLLIAFLAGAVSVLVTRRTVGRIESINATSRAIMDRGLDERIALRGVNDEWDELGKNLNSMLDRIGSLMQEIKEVTDNVAHDLRTPLARMRGRLEKASGGPREAMPDQKLIDDMIADLDDVLRIFSSLMRISQISAASRTSGFSIVNLSAVAHDVVELFDAAAEEKHVRLSVAGASNVAVSGDRDLLFDATANLVDNAIKHGNRGGVVLVTVAMQGNEAIIAVADDGPGIPAGEVPNIFKRFYRLERSRCAPGHGLGLSLVAAVAHLHGARIELADNRPGLAFRLIIPSAAAASGIHQNGVTE